jgi:hypothetical protein
MKDKYKISDTVRVIETGIVAKIVKRSKAIDQDEVYLTDWDDDVWFMGSELELLRSIT